MTKAQASTDNKIRILKWERNTPVTQEEAEARLHQEGYQSFCWYDVPGTSYPKHKHFYDECLWVLRGEMCFLIQNETYTVKSGDRIYLPAQMVHTVEVPLDAGVTFLVGQRRED